MIRSLFVAALAMLLSLGISNARAAGIDSDRILEKIAALEARVAELESKNQDYKRELAHIRAQPRYEHGNDLRMATAPIPTKAPAPIPLDQPRPEPSWTGAFWGASAGGAATRASTTSIERVALANPGNPPPFDLNGYTASDVSGPTKHSGAFVDLFAGWDQQISRFVLGGQIEATASTLDFSSSGTRSYSYFTSSGLTGATATGNYRPQVTSRWMASALLRAGVLLDDRTLLYGLGGWTFAEFEARNVTDNPFFQPNETFWANGPTGGVGIERRLDSNWRVRAEYRYTKFETARTQDQFSFVSNNSGSQAYSRSSQFDQSMQSGRIGFAYALNPLR